MQTITIEKDNAIKAFNEADEKGKTLLVNLLGKKHLLAKVTDRIKTFEDACDDQGEDPDNPKFHTGTPDEIAYKKLKVIAAALNEGKVLSFANKDQRKWYPWFEHNGSGFRFDGSVYDFTYSFLSGGSRLCYYSDEIARYAGTQFLAEYNQLLN
jgi:hypothetical protein